MANNRKPTADKLKKHVHETFEHVRKALDLRERLLNRQIDVLVNTTPRPNAKSNSGRPLALIDQLKFTAQNETAVLEHIRRLGKFNVDNCKFYADPTFAIEDYICPNADHDLMYKCLLNGNDDAGDVDAANGGGVQLDFSRPLAGQQQIVHLTVSESKELIAKSRTADADRAGVDGGSIDNATDEQRIAKMLIDNLNNDVLPEAVHPPVTPKSKKIKRKGKYSGGTCVAGNGGGGGGGGTINLKNISSLTINTMCSRENSVKKSSKAAASKQATAATVPSTPTTNTNGPSTLTPPPPPKSTSDVIMDTHSTMEHTSNAPSDSHGRPSDSGPIDYGCEFYNRLIAEITHTMRATPAQTLHTAAGHQHRIMPLSPTTPSSASASVTVSAASTPSSIGATASSTSSTAASPLSPVSSTTGAAIQHECSKMLFQNIRHLKITLPPASVSKINSRRSAADDPVTGTGELEQPVQIEQWLKQIISEPEVEPSPGADILEHSLIHAALKANE